MLGFHDSMSPWPRKKLGSPTASEALCIVEYAMQEVTLSALCVHAVNAMLPTISV
jgi:hypothetical protein